MNAWVSRAGNILVFALSILFTLAIAEIGFRAVMEVPIFDTTDWRADGARFNRIGDRAITDPLLGWTLKPRLSQRRLHHSRPWLPAQFR